MGSFVVNVIRVKQRYEDIDVQQGDSCHSSSRSLFTKAMVGRRLPCGRRGNSGTPLRTRGGRFGSSDFRARSEMTRPAVVARLEAISLAACRMSSSISRVVLTGGIISHHSSDVNRARTARQEVGECARRGDPGSVLQLSDESQVSRHKKGGGLRRKDLPEMVVSFPAASGRRRLDVEHNSVGGDLRQENVHLGLGELMPAGDVRSQQNVPILKQQFVRKQEAKLAGEHAVQDPGSRGGRDRGEKAGHQHVCVDNSRTLRHLLRRLALVSETASLIAAFSDIADRFLARATRAAAWLAVLIPHASRLSSTRLRIVFPRRTAVSLSARCLSGESVIVNRLISVSCRRPAYHQLTKTSNHQTGQVRYARGESSLPRASGRL